MPNLSPPPPLPVDSAGPATVYRQADADGEVWTCPSGDKLRSFIRRRNSFLDRLDAMLDTTRRCGRAPGRLS